MKGKVYKSNVKLVMLCGSETLYLKENEIAILRRAERSIVRVMCRVKLVNKRNTEELMDMFGLKEAAGILARVYGHGHVLRQPKEDVLMKAMVHEVDGKHKQGCLKMKWRKQVNGNMKRICLRKEDAAGWC